MREKCPEKLHFHRATEMASSDGSGGDGPLVREAARRRDKFVWPVTGGVLAVYLLALVALSYWPSVVDTKVWGSINVAYLIVLVQFALTFAVAFAYTSWARRRLDPLTADAHFALDRASEAKPKASSVRTRAA